MIRAVLFDVDGVLLDTLESNTRAYNHDFIRLGGREITVDEYRKLFHLPARNMFRKFFPEMSEQEIEEIIISRAERTSQFFKYAKLNPGVLDALKALKKSYVLGVVTSRMTPKILDHFAITGFFQVIVCLQDVKNHKPHPEPILLALERLKIRPEEAVYVGDAASDAEAAREAGVKSIIYRNPEVKGDWNISDFGEIVGIVEKANRN
jgi:HAD superfamily hydrolase (TIGR01509 family)